MSSYFNFQSILLLLHVNNPQQVPFLSANQGVPRHKQSVNDTLVNHDDSRSLGYPNEMETCHPHLIHRFTTLVHSLIF